MQAGPAGRGLNGTAAGVRAGSHTARGTQAGPHTGLHRVQGSLFPPGCRGEPSHTHGPGQRICTCTLSSQVILPVCSKRKNDCPAPPPPPGGRPAASPHSSHLEAHLQREGQCQVRLHLSTGGQHDLVGPQDALGALGGQTAGPSASQGRPSAHTSHRGHAPPPHAGLGSGSQLPRAVREHWSSALASPGHPPQDREVRRGTHSH